MANPRGGNTSSSQPAGKIIEINKNLDLSAAGYNFTSGSDQQLVPRQKPSTLGQPVKIGLNTYSVETLPVNGKDIYQYDVIIGNGLEKRGLMKKVWECPTVQKAVKGFIWDGNVLAWSLNNQTTDLNITVDLDREQGRPAREGKKKNECRIVMRRTKVIRFAALTEYLDKNAGWSESVIECINFFDHLLRETPSRNLVKIKRSFFKKGDQPVELGNAVEAFKGVYQSPRIVHQLRNGLHAARVSINVDVANGAFWKSKPLHLLAAELCGKRDVNDLINSLSRGAQNSREGMALLKLRKVRVSAKHRGKNEIDNYVIQRLIYKSASQCTFVKDDKTISIQDYYARTYNIRLQYPTLPLVETTKKGVIPMEILFVDPVQRYLYKLDERQTSNLVKFAATPPADRDQSISRGLQMLNWSNDPVLRQYGVTINPNKTVVEGRLLPAPKVQFGQGEAKPGTSGRWDVKGKKFLTPNSAALKAWSICVVPGRTGGKPDKSVVENFVKSFITVYTGHGGRVENKQPAFILAGNSNNMGADAVTLAWNAAGNQAACRPQILVFILPDKNADMYGRIKRSCECRYGVVSQCMQYAHVQKAQPQYISNVCMKFNAKLGGSTARAVGSKPTSLAATIMPTTMVIGADVSHAAPGSASSSMAALTVSMDKLGVRYAAACETNGHRVEMITTKNIQHILTPMVATWKDKVGSNKYPEQIFYFRDGVSERQYEQVINQEVKDIRMVFKKITGVSPKFLVVIGSKRHHIRFFPERGDRNNNPLPGTLVETGVTHPFENDFYLCTHAAIKGTARPTHYHVLLNETKLTNDDIQTILYDQCYQYIRATTPVSQHPAMYYAHIAAARAAPHDPQWGIINDASSDGGQSEETQLLPMPNQGSITTSMWYI